MTESIIEYQGDEYDFISYDQAYSNLTPEEKVLSVIHVDDGGFVVKEDQRCLHRQVQGWVCTLRRGHTGAHVAGTQGAKCVARWSLRALSLDIGPDEGC